MYQSPEIQLWKGRTDTEDGKAGYRWHQVIRPLNLAQPSSEELPAKARINIAFLGFCSDEGVRRNKGRVGAQQGPEALRKSLSNLPVHFPSESIALYDAGNVICPGQNLETAQELLGQKVARLLGDGFFPIVLGGGHEIAYGHYLGLHQYSRQHPQVEPLGIINLDAHFDLRSYASESSSGTPFRQIADLRRNHNLSFHYLVAGLQLSGNTAALFSAAERLNAEYLLADELEHSWEAKLSSWLNKQEKVYLTLDLDCIQASAAPGVSAPSPLGLDPKLVRAILCFLIRSKKIISLDLAELNPTLDKDEQTSKLAAQLIFAVVQELALTVTPDKSATGHKD
jgi:formiminoglutamase